MQITCFSLNHLSSDFGALRRKQGQDNEIHNPSQTLAMLFRMASLPWCLQGLCIRKYRDCNLDPGNTGTLKWSNWVSPEIHLFPDPVADYLMLSLMPLPDASGKGARTSAVGRCNIICSTHNITFWLLSVRDGIETRRIHFSIFSKSVVSYH